MRRFRGDVLPNPNPAPHPDSKEAYSSLVRTVWVEEEDGSVKVLDPEDYADVWAGQSFRNKNGTLTPWIWGDFSHSRFTALAILVNWMCGSTEEITSIRLYEFAKTFFFPIKDSDPWAITEEAILDWFQEQCGREAAEQNDREKIDEEIEKINSGVVESIYKGMSENALRELMNMVVHERSRRTYEITPGATIAVLDRRLNLDDDQLDKLIVSLNAILDSKGVIDTGAPLSVKAPKEVKKEKKISDVSRWTGQFVPDPFDFSDEVEDRIENDKMSSKQAVDAALAAAKKAVREQNKSADAIEDINLIL